MTDIVNFTPASVGGGFAGGVAQFAEAKPQVDTGGVPFLKLRKSDGVWVFGRDDVEVEDVPLALDANSLIMGYVDWKGGKPAGERMAVVGMPPVNSADLPPAQGPKGWEEQVGFGLIIMEGEDAGEKVLFKTNSLSGKEAFNATFDAMQARAAASKPFNPIVELSSDSYTHPEWGLIHKPIFTIVGWMGDSVAAVEAKPTEDGGGGEEAEPAEDGGGEVEATTRRRRRRAAAT